MKIVINVSPEDVDLEDLDDDLDESFEKIKESVEKCGFRQKKLNSVKRTCPHCEGDGFRIMRAKHNSDNNTCMDSIDCPECDGKGYVFIDSEKVLAFDARRKLDELYKLKHVMLESGEISLNRSTEISNILFEIKKHLDEYLEDE